MQSEMADLSPEGLPDSPLAGGVCKLSGYWCVGGDASYEAILRYANPKVSVVRIHGDS